MNTVFPLPQYKPWVAVGAVFALTGLIFGALAAHLPDHVFVGTGRAIAKSAIDMQMWHALALVALGLYGRFGYVCGGFAVGTVVFCAPVYFTALTGLHPGPIAPTGGLILMGSWLWLAIACLRR